MITAEDVILALSWSGEQPEMKNLISYAARFRIAVIAMTAERESSLAKAADVALTLPKAREACPHNLAPTTSSLMMLALGDALAIALLEGRGFTSVDFSVLHPGGKLGALLKYTRDLMHSGDAVPLKPLGTKMSDALVEMTSKGFGCVGIVDARGLIVGIVTDGDLRRHMGPDLMSATVDEVMTKNPKTIDRDVLAGEALEILNSSKITTLIVTDAGKPAGIVHLHDFLRAGVAYRNRRVGKGALRRAHHALRQQMVGTLRFAHPTIFSHLPEIAPPSPPVARQPVRDIETVR